MLHCSNALIGRKQQSSGDITEEDTTA